MKIPLRDGSVDLEGSLVCRASGVVGLTPTEHRLLAHLARQPGRVVGRDELLVEVWGYRAGVRTRTIDNAVRRLREKMEIDPSEPAHLVSVYGQGVKLVLGQEASEASPAASASFVGRDEERDLLARSIEAPGALVTITGPPGAGKTRLAEQALAETQLPAVRATLGGMSSLDDVLRVVSDALGVPATAVAVAGALAQRGGLLVLDGCDRVAEDLGELIRGWLKQAPQLRIVATSRRPVGLPEEQRIPLGPLPVDEAVALFLDRAHRAAPSFCGDHDDAVAIVSAVDRLPLLVELVAARSSVATAAQLRRMLGRRLDLLSGGRPGEPGIRATIDWSLDLLSPEEHDTLQRLAAFAGPFSLEDAEAVLETDWALDRVHALVDHSLLWVRYDAVARYALFDVIRDRVCERAPLPEEAVRRHASWFSRWAVQRRRTKLPEGLKAAVPELQAAFDRTFESEPDMAGRCAGLLLEVYLSSGPLGAARELQPRLERLACAPSLEAWLFAIFCDILIVAGQGDAVLALSERALALLSDDDAQHPTERHLRGQRARMLGLRGRYDDARSEIDRARALGGEVIASELAWLLFIDGMLHRSVAEHDEAASCFREAMALTDDDPYFTAMCATTLAALCSDPQEAERLQEEAVRLVAPLDARERASVLCRYAAFQCRQGRLDRARATLDELEPMLASMDDRLGAFHARVLRALMAAWSGDAGEARERLGPLQDSLLMMLSAPVSAIVAEICFLIGDPSEAERVLARSRDPSAPRHERFDQLRALMADEPGAVRAHLARAASLVGSREESRALHAAFVAICEARLGDLRAARAALASAEPSDGAARLPEGQVSFWLRRAELAVGLASRAVVRLP